LSIAAERMRLEDVSPLERSWALFSRRIVRGFIPACPDAKLETAPAQQVRGGDVLRECGWMAEVIVETLSWLLAVMCKAAENGRAFRRGSYTQNG
jgi:hypothetical protein